MSRGTRVRLRVCVGLFVGVFVGMLGVLSIPLAAVQAQEETDPFSLGEAFPPRSVRVEGLPSDEGLAPVAITLSDSSGRVIPLTGPGSVFIGSTLEVYPPRLPTGSYVLRHPGGELVFDVGKPTLTSPAPTAGIGLLWVLPLVALLPALVLVVRGRRIPGALVGVLAVAGASGVFLLGGSGQAALPQGDPCLGRQDLVSCATEYVVGVLDGFGPRTATDELVRLSSSPESPWARICHEPAHELGIRTWMGTGSLEQAISAGTTSCSLGYVHGLLQAMGTYLTDEEFPSAALSLCDGLDERFRSGDLVGATGDGPSTLLGCHHGVGHAAMWRFNEDLERAAPVCDGFAMLEQKEECRVGAVMEWVYAAQRAARSGVETDRPSPRVTQAVELCLPPIGVLSSGCVEGALTSVGPEGVAAARDWCVEHPEVLAACVQSLARRMVQMDLSRVAPLLDSVPEFCAFFDDQYPTEDCADRFGYMLLFLSRDLVRTEAFCAGLQSPLSTGCSRGVAKVLEYAEQIGDDSFNFTK